MSCTIIIGICVCVVGILGVALAFMIKDNDYLRTSSNSQSDTFKDLRTTIETQSKLIAKLEADAAP
jgi:hypothetical protein